jgi:hypothetical protein
VAIFHSYGCLMACSVCVLFYGNHFDLAVRCLDSIIRTADWTLIDDVRLGLNAVCPETRHYVHTTANGLSVPAYVYEPEKNAGKYPLMRRMFYGPLEPDAMASADRVPLSGRIMWFDDDSHITSHDPKWWSKVLDLSMRAQLIGAIWRIKIIGRQHQGIAAQPWYNSECPVPPGHFVRFVTGGWWVAHTEMLARWDYPFVELHHNGGDSILGELCRQQSYSMLHFQDGIAINDSERRGIKSPWIWESYHPTQFPDLSHHYFACQITKYGPGNRACAQIALPDGRRVVGTQPPLIHLPGFSREV